MTNDTISNDIPQRAVSLYGQTDAMDDFPVLKAFQQYVDAEQDKARKRILTLGAFFGIMLILVIGVFVFLLHGISVRNQNLSDQLVAYVMKDAERRQASVAQPQQIPAQSSADAEVLKAMTETLSAIQNKLSSPTEPADKTTPSPAEQERLNKIEADTIRLERMRAKLEAEKREVEAERTRLHEIEVDRQRRKLYPELYGETPKTTTKPTVTDDDIDEPTPTAPKVKSRNRVQKTQTPSRPVERELTDDDILDIIREAYPEADQTDVKEPQQKQSKTKNKPKPGKGNKDDDDANVSEDNAIEYFKDSEYHLPVDIKGKGGKVNFTLPVE